MTGYPCPEDLAGPLRDLLTGSTFEVRACRDLLPQMQAPQDREARIKVERTLKVLEAHAHLLPPLLHGGERIAFCCLLDWYWTVDRAAFGEALDQGDIANLTVAADEWRISWKHMEPGVRRELRAYRDLC